MKPDVRIDRRPIDASQANSSMVLRCFGNILGVCRAHTSSTGEPLVACRIRGNPRSCDVLEFLQVPSLRQPLFRSGDRHELNRTSLRVLWARSLAHSQGVEITSDFKTAYCPDFKLRHSRSEIQTLSPELRQYLDRNEA